MDSPSDSHVPADNPAGLEILTYAFNREHTVIDFKNGENGFVVADITDHVEALEELVNNDNY